MNRRRLFVPSSAAPSGTAGGDLTGTYPNPTIAGRRIAALTADVGPIASQTTLQNITGLGLTIGASATEIWLVKYWLLVNAANATMDCKFAFTVPTGCTMKWGGVANRGATANAWSYEVAANGPGALLAQTDTLATGTAALVSGTGLVAVVFGGGTAGTVQIQYAQNTSDVGNLKIDKGSVIEALRVAA